MDVNNIRYVLTKGKEGYAAGSFFDSLICLYLADDLKVRYEKMMGCYASADFGNCIRLRQCFSRGFQIYYDSQVRQYQTNAEVWPCFVEEYSDKQYIQANLKHYFPELAETIQQYEKENSNT